MNVTPLLVCPVCRAALRQEGTTWTCTGPCADVYPAIAGIPWLLAGAAQALGEWQLRLTHLVQRLDADAEDLKAELAAKEPLPALTLTRLRKLLQAKVEHRKALTSLLEPLAIGPGGPAALARAAQVKLPMTQSLTGYYANIHRDWGWETEENAAGLACVEAVLAPGRALGSLLVLGAGSGRLTYDLHCRHRPSLTVATDINPLMLLAAQRLFRGKTVRLYEFPLAPLDLESHAVLRKCAAPAAAPEIELVFADALRPAFADGVFDTVLTPWLVDIVPAELGRLAAAVNRLLRPGGTWLNFGSLAFNHAKHALNYSFEEAIACVAGAGFGPPVVDRRRVPYMQSPASCHGRVETVTSFAAEKQAEAPAAEPYQYLPAWLARSDVPVPKLKHFEGTMAVHAIMYEALALIDGRRTLSDLATAFAKRYGMQPGEAEASLRGVLVRLEEESRVGRQH